jgi:putative nucleotidyltransferase with HDIG domain
VNRRDHFQGLLAEMLGPGPLQDTLRSLARVGGIDLAVEVEGARLFSTAEGAAGEQAEGARIRHEEEELGCVLWSAAPEAEAARAVEGCRLAARLLEARLRDEQEKDILSGEILARYQEVNVLYEVGEEMARATETQEVCDWILKQAVQAVRPDLGVLRLYGEEAATLRTVSAHGIEATQRPVPLSPGSLCWEAIMEGKTLLMQQVGKRADDLRRLEGEFPGLEMPAERSLLALPLRTPKRVWGVLLLLTGPGAEPFRSEDVKFLSATAASAAVSLGHLRLYEDQKELFLSTVWSLAHAIDMKDPYTHGHSQNVAAYAETLALASGFEPKELETVRVAALLHDIGKIGIQEEILRKPAKLSDAEFRVIQQHPAKGEEVLQKVRPLRQVSRIVRHHHERWDGDGYPDGLKGDDIPAVSRIIHVCDAYDAMTNKRVYREKMPLEYVRNEYVRCKGSQFDPELASTFLSLIENGDVPYPTDSAEDGQEQEQEAS